jgi:pimeloyl-ACP methyl ester carboxylesterase
MNFLPGGAISYENFELLRIGLMPKFTGKHVSVHFEESGKGEDIILIHGGNVTSRYWSRVTDSLSFHTLAIDLYGCGGTESWPLAGYPSHDNEAELVAELIQCCKAGAHVVGHSYGAAVALRLAMGYNSSSIRSLVLIEPTAYRLLEQAGNAKTYVELCSWRDEFLRMVREDRVDEAWVSLVDRFSGTGTWEAMPDRTRTRLRETTDQIIGGFLANSNNPTTLAELRGVRIPTLAIQGEHTVRPEGRITQIVAEYIPGCLLAVVPCAGHQAPLTHPTEVADLISEHLGHFPTT